MSYIITYLYLPYNYVIVTVLPINYMIDNNN